MKTIYFILILAFVSTFTNVKAQNAEVKYPKQVAKANKWNAEQFTMLKKKFAFSTNCDTAKLKITILESRMESTGAGKYGGSGYSMKDKAHDEIAASHVGLEGCDQKAVYIFDEYGRGWVLNSNSK